MWDSHRLFLLSEFARYGTISAVAARQHFSVSTVSQQLAKLEDEVGVQLFTRDGRLLQLTPAGHALVEHAHDVLRLEDEVRSQLDAARPQLTGTVRIASLESTTNALIGNALDNLARLHPLLRVEVVVIAPEDAILELESLHFDLVIAEQYPGHHRERRPDVTLMPLGRDPLRLAVPPASTITDIAEASRLPFILEPAGTSARQWVVEQCRAAGFEPDERYVSANLQTHLQLVASGHAASILPDLMFATPHPSVRTVDLPGMPSRELVCMVRAGVREHPIVVAVFDQLRDALARSQSASERLISPPPAQNTPLTAPTS